MAAGHKTGGRQKGTPNKRTAVEDIAAKFDMDPFEVLMLVMLGDWKALGYEHKTKTVMVKGGGSYEVDVIALADRVSAAKEASKYLHSQRQSVAISGGDTGIKIIIEDYSKKS